MIALLRSAGPDDIERILPLVEAYHALEGISQKPDVRRHAVAGLLADPGKGRIFLLGPNQAPIGYIAITFGYSIEFGGRDAFIDEFFIREKVRGKGFGSRVLSELPHVLVDLGIAALHLEVDASNDVAQRFYRKSGFEARERYHLMTRKL